MSKCNDPAAACRCFTAEDACRLALGAYYAAGRAIEPPAGEPWDDGSGPWASARDFVDAFLVQVAARVYRDALLAGVDLRGGCSTQSLEGLAMALRELGRETLDDFSGPENDSLPLPENRADNQSGSGPQC